MTFTMTARFCRWASASDLPAVSMPSVTNAVSGASEIWLVPVTVIVARSCFSSCAHEATGQSSSAINHTGRTMEGSSYSSRGSRIPTF
jgi:hypothetical protein